MTKTEMKAIMKAWEARNQKVNTRAKAASVEMSIENDIAYTEMRNALTAAAINGTLVTGTPKTLYND